MPNTAKTNPSFSPKHHYARIIFSSLFGFFAVVLIIVSILVFWLNRTISDTDQYTKTVAPLVTNPDVQTFVIDKTSNALLDNDNSPITEIATELLGQAQVIGKTNEQLRAEIAPIAKDSLRSVIASPTFATLWKNTNSTIHEQLISQLNTDSPTITLNFHPLISSTISEMGSTKLGFVKDKLEIKDNVGTVTIEEKQLGNIRNVYGNFQKATLVIIGLAILAFALCVIISMRRWKAVRLVALLTGIFAGILAIIISVAPLIKVGGDDVVQQKFTAALVSGVTHDLRISLIIIAVLGIGSVVGYKVYGVVKAKKQLTQKK